MRPGFRNIVLTPQLIQNVEQLQRALGERDHDRLSLNDTIAFAIWRALAELERQSSDQTAIRIGGGNNVNT